MDQPADPHWLTWTRRLQAIAQTGLTFTRDHYDQERYQELRLIAAEMLAAGAGIEDSEKVFDLFRHERGYATPKIDVRGAVLRDDQVLLVRERDDGGWTLPGGWADVGDSPSAMVVREVKEESATLWRRASWRRYLTAVNILIRRSPRMPIRSFSSANSWAARRRRALRLRRLLFSRATDCPGSPPHG